MSELGFECIDPVFELSFIGIDPTNLVYISCIINEDPEETSV